MKDNFSAQASVYAQYRPGYPPALFDYLATLSGAGEAAWDCATGNGQIAKGLSPLFKEVYATDISGQQLAHAAVAANIRYSIAPAESVPFAGQMFDLVVVAQAVHWFQFDLFYNEVKRTLKKGGALVITGYDTVRVDPEIDAVIRYFHEHTVGPYWDPERVYVDEQYKTIPFPFMEMEAPALAYEAGWSLEHMLGYVRTWSAVQHYIRDRHEDPVVLLQQQLEKRWPPGTVRNVTFPILFRVGRV